MINEIPRPPAEALALSERLLARLRGLIEARGGWISFAEYMEETLYAPGLGYYSNGARKFGAEGDFVTAPELGPLFAACLARQLEDWLARDLPDVLEIGPGSGALAFDLLTALARLGRTPRRYYLLERSGDLRQRQGERLGALPPELRERVQWLERLPQEFEGVIVANEVLDALPVHRVGWRGHGLVEQGVGWTEHGPDWLERPLADEALRRRAAGLGLAPPYTSEIALAAPAWIASLLDASRRAALLFVDYGYGRAEYYHPQRDQGTLTGFYRHRRVDTPFLHPGLVDLTAHVDFTAVADAALESGGLLLGYSTQAAFLLDCGLTEALHGVEPGSKAYLQLAQQAQRLTHPAEMGELFKVMAIGKGFDEPGPGFTSPGREFQL